jgi:hypothetical protein
MGFRCASARLGGRRATVRAAALGLTLAGFVLASAALAAKSPVIIDEQWTRRDFPEHGVRKVAVLPAIEFGGYRPDHLASIAFFNAFRESGYRWLPPSSVYRALGATQAARDSMFRAIALQVRGNGHTDPRTSAWLTARLQVDALVVLRVERWEFIKEGSDATIVEVRAEMVDGSGEPLWRVLGRSRIFGEPTFSEVNLPPPGQGNKLTLVTPTGAPSGSQPSSGSSGSSGSGSGPGAGAPPPPPKYMESIEKKMTPLEDMLLATDTGPTSSKDVPFEAATRALMDAWVPLLPRPASAPPDSAGRPATPAR